MTVFWLLLVFNFILFLKKILNISFIERLHPGTADINEIFLLNLLEKYFNFFFVKAHNKLAFIKVLFWKNQNIYWGLSVVWLKEFTYMAGMLLIAFLLIVWLIKADEITSRISLCSVLSGNSWTLTLIRMNETKPSVMLIESVFLLFTCSSLKI